MFRVVCCVVGGGASFLSSAERHSTYSVSVQDSTDPSTQHPPVDSTKEKYPRRSDPYTAGVTR